MQPLAPTSLSGSPPRLSHSAWETKKALPGDLEMNRDKESEGGKKCFFFLQKDRKGRNNLIGSQPSLSPAVINGRARSGEQRLKVEPLPSPSPHYTPKSPVLVFPANLHLAGFEVKDAHPLPLQSLSLQQTVNGRVHLTSDMWASRHGQRWCILFTTKWVNLVVDRQQVVRGKPIEFVVPP